MLAIVAVLTSKKFCPDGGIMADAPGPNPGNIAGSIPAPGTKIDLGRVAELANAGGLNPLS